MFRRTEVIYRICVTVYAFLVFMHLSCCRTGFLTCHKENQHVVCVVILTEVSYCFLKVKQFGVKKNLLNSLCQSQLCQI